MLKNIQVLRFFAAFLVVLFHMQPPVSPAVFWGVFDHVTHLGFIGVDVFFVISGFVMAHSTRYMASGWISSLKFLILRFGRIYIGWWPIFILMYLIRRNHSGVDLLGSFLLWPQNLMKNLLPITWTLSFELYFYVAVAMIIIRWRQHASLILIAFALIIFSSNIIFIWKGMYHPENQATATANMLIPLYLSPLVLEFIFGFLISEFIERFPNQRLRIWILGAVIFLAAGAYYQSKLASIHSGMAGFFYVCERVFLFGFFSSFLVGSFVILESRGRYFWRSFEILGNSSYAIYLLHIPSMIVIMKLYSKFHFWGHFGDFLWFLFLIFTILLASIGYHKFVEIPLNGLLKRTLHGNGFDMATKFNVERQSHSAKPLAQSVARPVSSAVALPAPQSSNTACTRANTSPITSRGTFST